MISAAASGLGALLLLCVLGGCGQSSGQTGTAVAVVGSTEASGSSGAAVPGDAAVAPAQAGSGDVAPLDNTGVCTEYAQACSALELPPGVVFPGMSASTAGEDSSWEAGCGIVEAQLYWINAWTIEWLEQRGADPEREAKALDVLKNQVPSCELMTKYSDQNTRDWFSMCLEKAELGDPSGFQQTIDVNEVVVVREGEQ